MLGSSGRGKVRKIINEAQTVRELPSIVEMVGWRMLKHPDRTAFVYLPDGEREGAKMSFREVEAATRAAAAVLQQHGSKGDRVLLVYAPDLNFVIGFLACLYAGMVAVPVYPPDPTRMHKTLPRFRAVVADAKCRLALTTTEILPITKALAATTPEVEALAWLATDKLDPALGETWEDPWAGDDDVAMLQYTSGSTSTPKGVVITHRNLLHNERLIRTVAGHGEETVVVGWLPPYHDMGLIGMLLQPLYLGATCVFMPPVAFLKRPMVWLKALSKYKGTTSPAPNFAYDLCARKAKPEELDTLDLSAWTVGFNGAEPIRKETIERFNDVFARCKLNKTTVSPCYGLAEATLIVSGVPRGIPPTYLTVDADALSVRRVIEAEPGDAGAVTLVSSGRPLGDIRVLIVDPETNTQVKPGTVGEIWISGISVAKGYFDRPEETAATFGARLADGQGPFLRSGDLGFVADNDLYVVGRIKDLIIIRGRNIYPQDIEQTLERMSAAIRPGCVAAFSVEVSGEERLVVVAEVDPAKGAPAELPRLALAAVASNHDVQLHELVMLASGTIPKTTSGKIQRRGTRAAYLANELTRIDGAR